MRRFLYLSLIIAACSSGPTFTDGSAAGGSRIYLVRSPQAGSLEPKSKLFFADAPYFRENWTGISFASISTPRISPDGQRLAYGDGNVVRVLNLRDGTTRRLTPDGVTDQWPSWSGDGRRLMVVRRGNSFWSGWLVAIGSSIADSTHLIAIEDPNNSQPWWSPDQRKVVRIRWVPDSGNQVEVIDLASGEVAGITPPLKDGRYLSPTWSLDGRRIAFIEDHYIGESAIIVVTTPTGDPVTRYVVAGYAQILAWSPDGRQLAWCEQAFGDSDWKVRTWVIGAEEERTITPGFASECQPTWGRVPGGRR